MRIHKRKKISHIIPKKMAMTNNLIVRKTEMTWMMKAQKKILPVRVLPQILHQLRMRKRMRMRCSLR
jgi:hypothetical protein